MRLDEPLDAIVVGVPWIGRAPPARAAQPDHVGSRSSLGLALRQWRDAFPVREGGTLVLVHSLTRSFAHGTQDPYRSLFDALRDRRRRDCSRGRDVCSVEISARFALIAPDVRATRCSPTPTGRAASRRSSRLGRVIVAGSRDAIAARALGFVPSHSIASALEMAHGVAGGRARVGVLLAPPYAPLLVGQGEASLAPTTVERSRR